MEQLNMEGEQHYTEFLVSVLISSFSIFFPKQPSDIYQIQRSSIYYTVYLSFLFLSSEENANSQVSYGSKQMRENFSSKSVNRTTTNYDKVKKKQKTTYNIAISDKNKI